jgi:hypothetical protein
MTQTIKEQSREVANRLRDIVMSSMPLLLGLCNGADEAWFWELVLLASSPDTAKHISDEKLKELIQRHRIRRIKIHAVQDVLKGAHLAAAAGVCEGAAWQAKLLVAQLQLLSTQERAAAALCPARRGARGLFRRARRSWRALGGARGGRRGRLRPQGCRR